MINENLTTFFGLPVKDYVPAVGASKSRQVAYRFRVEWEQHDKGVTFTDLFDQYLSDQGAAGTKALVIGDWAGAAEGNSAEPVVKALVAARDRFPELEAIFIGDLVGEESEISWIMQTDMSSIWSAYPRLREFGIRGGEGLKLGQPINSSLEKLVIETGGLPSNVIKELATSQLPALKHLELWLGVSDYGGDVTVEDLSPILSGQLFPSMTYLGLRNSEIVDEIAKSLPGLAVIQQLDELDLSLGTLTNEGAAALAANAELRSLKKLNLHHHFVSPKGLEPLKGLGIEIDTSDAQEAEDYGGEIYRYVFASE